jgi:ATP adenylyltransferase
MNILYAPWREEYTNSTAQGPKGQENATPEECVFCPRFTQTTDEENLILARYQYNCIMLNRYPYNSGHLLIIPFKHKGNLEDFSFEVQKELIQLISHTTAILKKELNAHGINIGINLGKAAGAGIPAHLHVHVLPRWYGDTNFLPTLFETKQISTDLGKFYKRISPKLKNIPIY